MALSSKVFAAASESVAVDESSEMGAVRRLSAAAVVVFVVEAGDAVPRPDRALAYSYSSESSRPRCSELLSSSSSSRVWLRPLLANRAQSAWAIPAGGLS